MAFRRDGQKAHAEQRAWYAWREQYAELLQASGIPSQVLKTRKDWEYLLFYGYHADPYPEIDFRLEELTSAQRDAFRLLLAATLSHEEQQRGCAGLHFVSPPESTGSTHC